MRVKIIGTLGVIARRQNAIEENKVRFEIVILHIYLYFIYYIYSYTIMQLKIDHRKFHDEHT